MNDPVDIISAIAAVLSALGGAVAFIAAFKSAKHAKDTIDASQMAERRLLLRQLSITAYEVSVEVERIKCIAQGLVMSYVTLFTFSGGFNSSRRKLYEQQIDSKLQEVDVLLTKAKPFTTFQESLLNGPLEEISLREIAITKALVKAKLIREKFEDDYRSVECQNQTNRERVLSK